MKIHTEILGNRRDAAWAERLREAVVDCVELDQWTAQKSRFVARTERGEACAVALRRHAQLLDGDILEYDPDTRRAVAVRLRLNDVLVADLGALAQEETAEAIREALEFGHAVGNQHWPAVVRGTKVYIPLTVDRTVMRSVLRTHRFERIAYAFQPGAEVIPYLAPHEIRRLFGGAEPGAGGHGHPHEHPHEHLHEHPHDHPHEHLHEHLHDHPHDHPHDHAHDRSHDHPHDSFHEGGREQGHSHEHGSEYGHSHDHGCGCDRDQDQDHGCGCGRETDGARAGAQLPSDPVR